MSSTQAGRRSPLTKACGPAVCLLLFAYASAATGTVDEGAAAEHDASSLPDRKEAIKTEGKVGSAERLQKEQHVFSSAGVWITPGYTTLKLKEVSTSAQPYPAGDEARHLSLGHRRFAHRRHRDQSALREDAEQHQRRKARGAVLSSRPKGTI